jgi:hypothetical protein
MAAHYFDESSLQIEKYYVNTYSKSYLSNSIVFFILFFCWRIHHNIYDSCIISWQVDTILFFLLLLSISNRWSEKVSKNIKFKYLYHVKVRRHRIYVRNIFHLERVVVERLYTYAHFQCISLDKTLFFLFFRMVNISKNMESESNPYLNWNWDIDASSSLLNQIY